MHTMVAEHADAKEVTVLARVLGNGRKPLPREVAHYILTLGFTDDDKCRMHELAARNQDGTISREEKEELFAYAKTGSLLSILKSKARRALKIKANRRPVS